MIYLLDGKYTACQTSFCAKDLCDISGISPVLASQITTALTSMEHSAVAFFYLSAAKFLHGELVCLKNQIETHVFSPNII